MAEKNIKGVILAGGTGSRLMPMTKVTNKHLLPVYNQPMVMWPLQKLINAGIRDIMIVSGKGHAGHFLELLGSGRDYGVSLSYAVQEEAGGIAEALLLTEEFAIDGSDVAVILGDNIYENDLDISNFNGGARIFLKEVHDPERYGVATVEGSSVIAIEEKPKVPKSNLAVSGFYMYDNTVYDKIRSVTRSARGELEITDVNNLYINDGVMEARTVDGFWTDAGTIDSLYLASTLIKEKYGRP